MGYFLSEFNIIYAIPLVLVIYILYILIATIYLT